MIDKKLAGGKYAAITLVYNETSTGLTNPLYEISEMMKKKYPDVLVFVDAVSGLIGLPVHFDRLLIPALRRLPAGGLRRPSALSPLGRNLPLLHLWLALFLHHDTRLTIP
jgi:aspartate aminotransferase-like enzyme